MKILLLAPQPFYQERGTPIAVRLLAMVLGQAGHQVDILAYHEGRDLRMPGVRISRIPSPPWISGVRPGPSWQKAACDVLMMRAARQMAAKGGYDLVHAVEEGAFMALNLKKKYGLPFVYDMDSSMSRQVADKFPSLTPAVKLFDRLERGAARESAGVVAVCDSLAELARAQGAAGPLLVLQDISLLDVPPPHGNVSPPSSLGIDGPVVMYVGNLESYQGIDLLLAAFRRVREDHPRAKLVVIGGSQQDIVRYKALAEQMGLAGRARFVGPRPPEHLGFYLGEATVVVSPRIHGDNTPMKVYSYLDCGRPLLATRLPTHTQVVDDGMAMLVEPQALDMARGLGLLLDDADLRGRLAEAARAKVRAEHSLEVFKRKLLGFYAALEAGGLAAGPGERR